MPGQIEGIHEFDAAYTAGNVRILVRLGQPAMVLDADLALVQAYPLEIRLEGANNPEHIVHWLSGDLRIIRTDDVCRREPCPGNYAEVTWVPRGQWPPLGVGFNRLVQTGDLALTQWGMRHEVEPRQTRDGASLNLSFSGPLAERPFFANSYLGFQRWFSYADDDIVPEAFGASDGKAVLTNFKEKSVLPKIPSLRIIGTAGTDSGTGQWWAGSDRPVLGATVSADEAIAALRERSDDFSAAIKNECIGGFITLAPYNSSNVGGLMPTQVHSTYFNLQTHKSNAEVARTWIWTRDESPLLGTVWNSQLPTEQAVNAPACAPGGVKPPVVHDAQAHIDLATRFPWNPSKRADGFFVSTQPGEALIGEDSPWLQVAFRTSFAAEGESQGLRSVALEASAVGLWLAIGGEPAELAELEGEYGWPASAGFAAA